MTAFLLNCALLLAAPLFFTGLVRFAGSRGNEHPLKPVREFLSLLAEGVKPGNDTSFTHETASSLILASILMAGTLTPLVGHQAVLGFDNSGILFFSFLLLEKIVRTFGNRKLSVKAKETAADIFWKVLPELALYLLLIAASWASGTLSFGRIFSDGLPGTLSAVLFRVLFPLTLFILLLKEEDSGADGYRGSDKAVVHFSSSLKDFLFAALIAGFILPYAKTGVPGLNVFLYFFLFILITALIAVLTGAAGSLLKHWKIKRPIEILLLADTAVLAVLAVLSPLF
jgi:hypothetical protein